MPAFAELLGDSREIGAIREQLSRLLARPSDGGRLPPILILGETGSGKTALARAIHRAGPRASGPFIDVNCAAIPDTLLEAELFGYERGAFTDARNAKPGLFQAAHRGTIFLDEIGLLPEALQPKLLKVIEERTVRRLGSTRSEPVDVAILTATAEDLTASVRHRRFREDLYHRLAVITLTMPPLRTRGDDVLALAEHFLSRSCAEYGLPRKTLGANTRRAIATYHWPGNVRELANVMERVALLSDAAVVTAASLGLPQAVAAAPDAEAAAASAPALSFDEKMKDHLLEALEQHEWNLSRAATALGIARNTLRARIEKYGLKPGRAPTRRAPRAAPPARAAPSTPHAAPGSLRWEPRRLTLLRAEVDVAHALDFQLYASRGVEVLVEKIRSFGGRIEELSPAAILASFGLQPIEDAPLRAAHAATAMLRAATRAETSGVERLTARIGIHVGEFLIARAPGAGQIDLNAKRAAWAMLEQLLAGAEPDTVVVSEAAHAFLERRFEMSALPVDVNIPKRYRLAGRERTIFGGRRRLAELVGRAGDLETLRSRLDAAAAGRAQVVGIVGEAGIGKSRLVYEFREHLGGQPITWTEGRCVSYGASVPYLPILDVLRQHLEVTEGDSAASLTTKVEDALIGAGVDVEASAPFLLELLGVKPASGRRSALSPEAIKTRTFDALRRLTLAHARERPLVYVIEDLQWIDPTSQEFIDFLVESFAGSPILLIATYRPGYRPSWIAQSYATQLSPRRLTSAESQSVVQSLRGAREVPASLIQLILEKGEGNPFFLEELWRTVKEQHDSAPSLAVPNTVQEVLLARVDRLGDEPRRLLQAAAVVGRRAPARLLRALWTRALDAPLAELVRLEFVHEEASRAEPVWTFTHALVQEVAYESLPADERRALHAEAARALEAQYADRLDDVLDRLAHHYSRAERADRAVEYLVRSADRAARAYAHAEAAAALEQALAHVERLPEAERDRRHLDLVLRLVHSLSFLGRFAEIVMRLFETRDRFERLDDPSLAGPYHFWLARACTMLGDPERAGEHGRRALEAAEREGDDTTAGKALYVLAFECFWSGRCAEGIDRAREAAARFERATDSWWLSGTLWIMAVNLGQQGNFAGAIDVATRGLAIGESLEDRRLQSLLRTTRGGYYALMGDADAAIPECQRALALAPDPVMSAMSRGILGGAHLERGDAIEAIPLLEQSAEDYATFGVRQMQGWFTTLLGEAWLLRGDAEKARALATDGLEIAESIGYRHGIGWAQRALGRIATASGDTTQAAKWLGHALETFTASGARYDVARTEVELARLAARRGDATRAGSHLTTALGTFEALELPACVARVRQVSAEIGVRLVTGSAPRA